MIIRLLILIQIFIGISKSFNFYPPCVFRECCTKSYIPANFTKLEFLLKTKVFGQHLVTENVAATIKAHWNSRMPSPKALTLSFHGWPGSGKNYVSQFIQDSLYYYGGKSKYVHHFIGRIHFPLVSQIETYKEHLYNWIKGNVSDCPKQLFIFDEVDKMPPGLLNVITPLIDYREGVDKVDYRQAIFIFLSNTGSTVINRHVLSLWEKGKTREDLKMVDFEKLIALGSFNEEGGFHHSDTIKSNLIDHYLPFLPLEYVHVRLCIISEFVLRNVHNFADEHIQEVMDFIEWGPEGKELYSKTGCKRISQKVGMIIIKYRLLTVKDEL